MPLSIMLNCSVTHQSHSNFINLNRSFQKNHLEGHYFCEMNEDKQDADGSSQLCGGQIAGIEMAIHSMRSLFENEETEHYVDASST